MRRIKPWDLSRACKRTRDCLSIEGHYGACRLPDDRTRDAIATASRPMTTRDLAIEHLRQQRALYDEKHGGPDVADPE